LGVTDVLILGKIKLDYDEMVGWF